MDAKQYADLAESHRDKALAQTHPGHAEDFASMAQEAADDASEAAGHEKHWARADKAAGEAYAHAESLWSKKV